MMKLNFHLKFRGKSSFFFSIKEHKLMFVKNNWRTLRLTGEREVKTSSSFERRGEKNSFNFFFHEEEMNRSSLYFYKEVYLSVNKVSGVLGSGAPTTQRHPALLNYERNRLRSEARIRADRTEKLLCPLNGYRAHCTFRQ